MQVEAAGVEAPTAGRRNDDDDGDCDDKAGAAPADGDTSRDASSCKGEAGIGVRAGRTHIIITDKDLEE